jgi:hypothetical protein
MAGGGSPRRRHRLRGRQLEPLDPLEEGSSRLWECLPAVDGRRDQMVLLRRPARAVSGIHEMASAVSGIHEMASARRTRGRVVHVMGALISVHPVAAAAPRRRAGRPVTRRAGRPATRWLAADAAATDATAATAATDAAAAAAAAAAEALLCEHPRLSAAARPGAQDSEARVVRVLRPVGRRAGRATPREAAP